MNTSAIIIEAGQQARSLDTRASQPRTLNLEKQSNKPVLDWIISALKKNNITHITYIGNYHIEKVVQQFPELEFIYYNAKQYTNEIEALKLYQHKNDEHLIVLRSDIVVLPTAFENLSSDSVTLHYMAAPQDNDSVAFIHLPQKDSSHFFHAISSNQIKCFHDIREAQHLTVQCKQLSQQAAAITKPHLLSEIIFQGKGKTLENLAPIIKNAIVLDQVRFTYQQWSQQPEYYLAFVSQTFPETTVVVRSNTQHEDSHNGSQAGAYLSLLNIASADKTALKHAINNVFASYAKQTRVIEEQDEILIQKQVSNIKASGVLLTRSPHIGAPYFVLSLDRQSGTSDSVTSGHNDNIENYYIAWHSPMGLSDPIVSQIIEAAREILRIAPIDALDIEFCIDTHGKFYLLQVRPQIISQNNDFQDREYQILLRALHASLTDKMAPSPELAGDKTIFAIMPDWNPAEIIGIHPKPLACSLYQKLVTNRAWARARACLGYKSVAEPLLHTLAGAPYIDVRASLHSLFPANLDHDIEEAICNWTIEALSDKPYLQDKVEFELYFSTLSPNWPKYHTRLQAILQDDALVNTAYKALHQVTKFQFQQFDHIVQTQQASIEALTQRTLQYHLTNQPIHQISQSISDLTDDLRENGIIPFAIFARLAFVSMRFLQDFVALDIFDEGVKNSFLNAIPTVASCFHQDSLALKKGDKTIDNMVAKYGHLRPSSYDITVDNYAANPHVFTTNSDSLSPCQQISEQTAVSLLEPYRQNISAVLNDLNLECSFEMLNHFMIKSIQLREWAKFEFMKTLDKILQGLTLWGKHVELDKEALSYLHIDDVLRYGTDSVNPATIMHLKKTISFNQKQHALLKNCHLPELITHPDELFCVKQAKWQPNFITLNKVSAPICHLQSVSTQPNLSGMIVCIESADPGFDWIFSHPIAGLITAFGGVASHMAIRAAEFNLPAAIGCGLSTFHQLVKANTICLNCEQKSIQVVA